MQSSTSPSQRSADRATPINTAKGFFFAAAGISFLVSVALWFSGDHERGMFVGLWVPAIHSLGTLVLTGERFDRGDRR